MANVELRAERRAVTGKKVRFLRRDGLLPANLYGPGVASVSLQLPARETEAALRRISSSTLVPLIVETDPARRVLVRQIQRHPVSDQVLHLDLFAVSMSETMRTPVSLHFTGEAPAVKTLEGTLIPNMESVEVEALPTDLPSRIDVDLSGMDTLHSVIHVRDLIVPEHVTILTPEDALIVSVAAPRLATAEVTEAAEGEAAPEAGQEAEAASASETSETEEGSS